MAIMRVGKRDGTEWALPLDDEQGLRDGIHRPEGQVILDSLRHEWWVRCLCEIVLHVHQASDGVLRLRRNPGKRARQSATGRTCWLCRQVGQGRDAKPRPAPPRPPGLGLIRARRISRPASAWTDLYVHAPTASVSAWLTHVVETAGWDRLPAPRPEAALWQEMRQALRSAWIPLGRPLLCPEAITWTPHHCVHGIASFARNVRQGWPQGADFGWEMWMMAILDDEDVIDFGARTTIRLRDQRERVHRIEVATPTIPKLNTAGPYLALLAGGPHPETGALTISHMARVAIASRSAPVPVESSYERDVVHYLQRRGIRFIKPLTDDKEGIRPDFLLPDLRIVIEVLGYDRPRYITRKQYLLSRYQARGWTPLSYHPHPGRKETLKNLEAKLAARGG
jgi:hypothetical protein